MVAVNNLVLKVKTGFAYIFPFKPTNESIADVFGTSPHGLSVDLRRAIQKTALAVALDTLLLNRLFGVTSAAW